MTPRQLQLLHLAKSQAFGRDDDARYRLLLKNVAGVTSSKDLTNPQFDEVMAVLEASGFHDKLHGQKYWQIRCKNPIRLIHKAIELSTQQRRYPLEALVSRFSAGRTEIAYNLHPKEAWNLVEMLKNVIEREKGADDDLPF